MRIIQQIGLIVLIVFLNSFQSVEAQTQNSEYNGYRLHIFDIKSKKKTKNELTLLLSIANTGRKLIDISPQKPLPFLNVVYNPDLNILQWSTQYQNINDALSKAKLKLSLGEVISNFELKILNASSSIQSEQKTEVIDQSQEGEIELAFSSEEEETCFDVLIDTIKIIKRTKSKIDLEYTLHNISDQYVPMLGESKLLEDNLAIRAYISGVDRMSKGALVIGGTFVENMGKDESGKLPPGKKYKAFFSLDLRSKSRYMNYLIFRLDPFQTLRECNERNNVYVLSLVN